jgi:hypothetical protein
VRATKSEGIWGRVDQSCERKSNRIPEWLQKVGFESEQADICTGGTAGWMRCEGQQHVDSIPAIAFAFVDLAWWAFEARCPTAGCFYVNPQTAIWADNHVYP